MKSKKDDAGVNLPPSFIYAGFFFIGWFLQNFLPINNSFIQKDGTKFIGSIFFLLAIYLGVRGVGRFIKTGNTIVTVRPSSSLQQEGMYQFTRNPMYLGMISSYWHSPAFLEIGGILFCFRH